MNKQFRTFLLSLYKPVKVLSVVMIVSMILCEVFKLIKQYIIKGIIDLPGAENFEITELYRTGFVLLIFVVLEIACWYTSNITRRIFVFRKQTPYISEVLFNHLGKKTYPFFVDNYSGKISSSINEISELVSNLNSRVTVSFVSLLTSMLSNLLILYTIDFRIFTTALILFTGIIVMRIVFFSKKYLPIVKKAQEYNREYNGILNDAVLNFTSLKVYSAIANFSKTLKSKKEEANAYTNKATTNEHMYGAVANIVFIVVMIILMIYSIKRFESNQMSLGNFVFFINAMITIKNNSTNFAWSYISISEILVRIQNCYELLYSDNNVEEDDKEDIIVESGKVEFKDMSFKYDKSYVFEDFNFVVNDNQKIGIIGVSGSGKTTLVNLLFKFYSPQKGQILIDGKDIDNYNTSSLYKNLTYVPQETILLHSSIYENIKIAKPDASVEEIVNAAKRAELHEFIESLDNKYDTIVGERGIKLSGGQRQRIALARIFLRDAKIVIFDEATSSLDNNTEFKIQKNIHKYFNNQTILCIAHRLSTLKDMDYILVIEKGQVVDFGTPEEIIPKYDNKEFTTKEIENR